MWWIVGVVILSFLLTNLLVGCLQRRRVQRIEMKADRLFDSEEQAARLASAPKIPLTLITGFLGSGKTTLVNQLLSGDHGLRIVVIENELGSISIDHALIDRKRQQAMPDGLMVLKNGCMCCSGESPGSELERVLDKLLELASLEEGSMPFDAVIIETSGLADPSPIVQVWAPRSVGEA